jgi:predicted DNA-binding WGR domain protein
VGQSKFRCDIAVRAPSEPLYQLAILIDTDAHYANQNLLDRYFLQPSVLRAFGWRFTFVLTKDWYHQPDEVLSRLEKLLRGEQVLEAAEPDEVEVEVEPMPAPPKPVVVPPTPKALTNSTSARRFEFVGGSSRKFWEVSQAGASISVRFGRIGTAGQEQSKTFADESGAAREIERLIAEKVKKGYVEIV